MRSFTLVWATPEYPLFAADEFCLAAAAAAKRSSTGLDTERRTGRREADMEAACLTAEPLLLLVVLTRTRGGGRLPEGTAAMNSCVGEKAKAASAAVEAVAADDAGGPEYCR